MGKNAWDPAVLLAHGLHSGENTYAIQCQMKLLACIGMLRPMPAVM